MPVGELRRHMTEGEFRQWSAYYEIKAKEQKRAQGNKGRR